jgi:hypothetical protein
VIALQIANEVNISFSPDSSDGAYERATEALVTGVIAAKREVRRLRLHRLRIGFNWFWRLDEATERRFWAALRDHGGRRFAQAVDWIGLDAYPGTVFPSSVPLGGERDAIVTALRSLRCFARVPGIPRDTPIKVEENGWPTLLPTARPRPCSSTSACSSPTTTKSRRSRPTAASCASSAGRLGFVHDLGSARQDGSDHGRGSRHRGRDGASRRRRRCQRGARRARAGGAAEGGGAVRLERRRLRVRRD